MSDKPNDERPLLTLEEFRAELHAMGMAIAEPRLSELEGRLDATLLEAHQQLAALTADRDRLREAGAELLAALCGLTISADEPINLSADDTQFRLVVARANAALKNMQAALAGDANAES